MTKVSSSERTERYTISQLCREFDVTPRTLRFYEQKELLHPAREGLNRIFTYRDRARLKLILRGKKVGFSLDEIKGMLDLYHVQDGEVRQLQVGLAKGTEQLENLREQRAALNEAIADLESGLQIVRGLLEEKGVSADAGFPEAKSA